MTTAMFEEQPADAVAMDAVAEAVGVDESGDVPMAWFRCGACGQRRGGPLRFVQKSPEGLKAGARVFAMNMLTGYRTIDGKEHPSRCVFRAGKPYCRPCAPAKEA